jgi:hypothetical protein
LVIMRAYRPRRVRRESGAADALAWSPRRSPQLPLKCINKRNQPAGHSRLRALRLWCRPVAQASHPQRPGNSNFDRFGYHGDIPDPSASPVESGAAAMEYAAENLFRQPRPTLCMASCKVLRLEKPLLNSPAVRAATNDKLHVPRVSFLQHLWIFGQ